MPGLSFILAASRPNPACKGYLLVSASRKIADLTL